MPNKSKESVMNLFSIRPNTELVGVEEERNKLVSYIQNGNICFLNCRLEQENPQLLNGLKKK